MIMMFLASLVILWLFIPSLFFAVYAIYEGGKLVRYHLNRGKS